MNLRAPFTAITLAVLAFLPLVAQAPSKKGVPIQEQIQALREGQAEMMRELAEIKGLLKAGAKADAPAEPEAHAHLVANVNGEPFRGDAKARVAILEYSDFDCPYCGRYAREIYPELQKAYVDTGKIKYFFRDLPLPDHEQAPYKANLARMAGEQGKFWEAHDYLFAHQTPMDDQGLELFAKTLSLDKAKLDEGLKAGKYDRAIKWSMATARQMQLKGTPAFLIGTMSEDGQVFTATKVIMGGQSFDEFKEILDGLLNPAAQPKTTATAKPASSAAAVATCG